MIDESRRLSARLLAASPLAMSLEDALAHIRGRRKNLLATPPQPEPDFTKPEPMPVIDNPDEFGRDFWNRRPPHSLGDPPPPPKTKAPKPRGRKPIGNLPPEAERRFRVIDGDADGDKEK